MTTFLDPPSQHLLVKLAANEFALFIPHQPKGFALVVYEWPHFEWSFPVVVRSVGVKGMSYVDGINQAPDCDALVKPFFVVWVAQVVLERHRSIHPDDARGSI